MPDAPRPPVLPVIAFAAAAISPLAFLAAGLITGGAWSFAALAWMILVVLALDLLLPLAAGTAAEGQEFPGSEALLVALGLSALCLLPLLCALPVLRPFGPADLALLFAAGLWLGQVGHPAAHELIHRPGRLPRTLGRAVYTALLIGHHASAHRLVHHALVGTSGDPNTARAGESFWRFMPRAWIGSFRAGLHAESARGSRAYALHILGALAALTLAALIGGPAGLLLWLALAGHAQFQIFLSDYIQHYGLTRGLAPSGKPLPVTAAQSWNAGHWASSALMLNATRHSDHHVHPGTPYPALALPPDAPRLPWPLPLAAAVALYPPLWRRRMDKALAALKS